MRKSTVNASGVKLEDQRGNTKSHANKWRCTSTSLALVVLRRVYYSYYRAVFYSLSPDSFLITPAYFAFTRMIWQQQIFLSIVYELDRPRQELSVTDPSFGICPFVWYFSHENNTALKYKEGLTLWTCGCHEAAAVSIYTFSPSLVRLDAHFCSSIGIKVHELGLLRGPD